MPGPHYSLLPPARFGLAALLALAAALASFAASCAGHWGYGLTLAILSLPLGLTGLLRAASPEICGAFLSIAAVILGLVGVAVAVLSLILAIDLY